MPNPTTASGIRDNHRRWVVTDFLKPKIQPGSRFSAASASIARTFQKRVAAGPQSGRDFVIPHQQQQQARETTEIELIIWLVVKAP